VTHPSKQPSKSWDFVRRLRPNALGWRASTKAISHLKAAVKEIRGEAKRDPVRAAEGVVRFAERLWPALQHVDSSSGALGTAVTRACAELIPVLRDAPLPVAKREALLERLFQAHLDDGVDYTMPFADVWGELCGSSDLAALWADRLSVGLRSTWTSRSEHFSYFRGTSACLSSLLAADRIGELMAVLELAPYRFWSDHRYGAEALLREGHVDEAVRYAETCDGQFDGPRVAAFCERALLAAGKREEAYRRYALRAHQRNTALNTFRALAKAYPELPPQHILEDLIAASDQDPGTWFATAKDIGAFELAVDLARRGRPDPRTLIRAARDHARSHPDFAIEVGLLALRGLARGDGYEMQPQDVRAACVVTIAAGRLADREDEVAERGRALAHAADARGHLAGQIAALLDGCLAGQPDPLAELARFEAHPALTVSDGRRRGGWR